MEAEDDDGDLHDGVRTSSTVLCGRNSRGGWVFSHMLHCKGNSEINNEVLC